MLHDQMQIVTYNRDEIEIDEKTKSVIENEFYCLSKYHKKEKDCSIIAEAIAFEIKIFLTCDDKLLKHISSHAGIKITKPSLFFDSLNIPKGARIKIHPHEINPLFRKTWWNW